MHRCSHVWNELQDKRNRGTNSLEALSASCDPKNERDYARRFEKLNLLGRRESESLIADWVIYVESDRVIQEIPVEGSQKVDERINVEESLDSGSTQDKILNSSVLVSATFITTFLDPKGP
ncbi:hypothetical protein L596_022605 [Steinernema carpocapsae]|uniref:Uncharacterized protein n=1 Tax=Steinernema carpocapsae TaxID=34508 RepID=A0A4U5MM84_STECR|nr:hypothetical protein L596_022605 [Steinernema carpocapsae]